MVLCRRTTLKTKDRVVWFINTNGLESWAVAAKFKQLSSWISQEQPFGTKYEVVLIPSNEDKFCLLATEEEFKDRFQGDDPNEWLDRVKNKLRDCLTVHIPLQTDE